MLLCWSSLKLSIAKVAIEDVQTEIMGLLYMMWLGCLNILTK